MAASWHLPVFLVPRHLSSRLWLCVMEEELRMGIWDLTAPGSHPVTGIRDNLCEPQSPPLSSRDASLVGLWRRGGVLCSVYAVVLRSVC